MTELLSLIREYFVEPDSWLDTYTTLNPVWVAHVSFPHKTEYIEITDDNERPGEYVPSWLRLKQLVEDNNLLLQRLYVRWRKSKILAEENQEAYFFARKVDADAFSGKNFYSFLTGRVREPIIEVSLWDLQPPRKVGFETRNINEVKPEFIIWNTCMIQNTQTQKLGRMDT